MTDAYSSSPLLSPDATLDEIRLALAPRLAANAAFDGWTMAAVESAAFELDVDADIARIAFKDGGAKGSAMDLIDAWTASIDGEMTRRLPVETLAAMKIRERITALIEARLAIAAPDKEGQRRALTIMAQPQNLLRTARIGWRAADVMWRLAGDNATDFNHYTKRATLSAVYSSTLAFFMQDDSEEYADTRAFLARRIDNVMQFEKVKAGLKGRTEKATSEHRISLSRFIGRLRYPAR